MFILRNLLLRVKQANEMPNGMNHACNMTNLQSGQAMMTQNSILRRASYARKREGVMEVWRIRMALSPSAIRRIHWCVSAESPIDSSFRHIDRGNYRCLQCWGQMQSNLPHHAERIPQIHRR